MSEYQNSTLATRELEFDTPSLKQYSRSIYSQKDTTTEKKFDGEIRDVETAAFDSIQFVAEAKN